MQSGLSWMYWSRDTHTLDQVWSSAGSYWRWLLPWRNSQKKDWHSPAGLSGKTQNQRLFGCLESWMAPSFNPVRTPGPQSQVTTLHPSPPLPEAPLFSNQFREPGKRAVNLFLAVTYPGPPPTQTLFCLFVGDEDSYPPSHKDWSFPALSPDLYSLPSSSSFMVSIGTRRFSSQRSLKQHCAILRDGRDYMKV